MSQKNNKPPAAGRRVERLVRRFRRSRATGARLPSGVVCVTRPGVFGNPFPTASEFRTWLERLLDDRQLLPAMDTPAAKHMGRLAERIEELRGKSLACWCPLSADCHADVLLEFANR